MGMKPTANQKRINAQALTDLETAREDAERDPELLAECRRAIAAFVDKWPSKLKAADSPYQHLLVQIDVRLGNE